MNNEEEQLRKALSGENVTENDIAGNETQSTDSKDTNKDVEKVEESKSNTDSTSSHSEEIRFVESDKTEDDGREKLRKAKEKQDSNNTDERYVPTFEDLVTAGAVTPVPTILNDDVKNSVTKVHDAMSYYATNREGKAMRRFPNQDLYSGRVVEVSNAPIIFPKRTGYGEDRFVIVELDNGLSIFVPARQAGLTQPRSLSQLMGVHKSVVITDIFDKSGAAESGNDLELFAIGSIQMAEYQIGAQLSSEFTKDPINFTDHIRKGIITHVDRNRQEAVVTIDLTENGEGYLDTRIKFDDLAFHYTFQNITDIPWIQEGNEITFCFKNIYEREINNKDKNIKGTYFDIECTRAGLPGYGKKEADGKVARAIALGTEHYARLLSYSPRSGYRVEVVPQQRCGARIAQRISGHLNITKQDIKNHCWLQVTFDRRVHKPSDLNKFKQPVIITKVEHSKEKTNAGQIAINRGSHIAYDRKEFEKTSAKLSVQPKVDNSNKNNVNNALARIRKNNRN